MGTLRVPGVVPSPDQDCERLKKAFDGMSLCHFVCVCVSLCMCVFVCGIGCHGFLLACVMFMLWGSFGLSVYHVFRYIHT